MEVLAAHQEHTTQLRETLDRLIGLHSRLFELRSNSWREQMSGDRNRASVLDDLHHHIDAIEAETELLRGQFSYGVETGA